MVDMLLKDIVHPEYQFLSRRWRKWRLTYEAGDFYIEQYLIRLKREHRREWIERMAFTCTPAFAKEAVNEVKNSIFQRLGDVIRTGGPDDYAAACAGLKGGVDRKRSTMANFIGRKVLPEMLTMRRVGVWVDMPSIDPRATKATVGAKRPYLYLYPVEAIRSWATDDEDRLTRLLIQESNYRHDEATGLPMSGSIESYRLAWIDASDGLVHVRTDVHPEDKELAPVRGEEVILNLTEIPFVMFEIEHSLLEDVANHQAALLNMNSADIYWCVKANRPIYTEQFDPREIDVAGRPAQQAEKFLQPLPPGSQLLPDTPTALLGPPIEPGQAKEASEGKDTETTMGTNTGRGYALGLERPGFIHPSSEPITASMAKAMELKQDIRRLVQLSVASLDPKMASAESKDRDENALQNGLCAIGAALQQGENEIAYHWAAYRKGATPASVRYPEIWTRQSDADRRADAAALGELKDEVPSRTCQREILKQMADKLVGHKVPPEKMDVIHAEIERAQCVTANIDDLEKEIQLRIVSAETASLNRGYPAGEHQKALDEQAKQLAIIAISQSKAGGGGAGAARGVPGGDPNESKDEKKLAAGGDGTPRDASRGPGAKPDSEKKSLKPPGHQTDREGS